MTVSQVEPRPLINDARLAGDIAQRTPPGSPFLMVLAPSEDYSSYHEIPMQEKWWSRGTNQAFSRKVLGMSQDAADLLGEQTSDLQTWESNLPGPWKEKLCCAGDKEVTALNGLTSQAPRGKVACLEGRRS